MELSLEEPFAALKRKSAFLPWLAVSLALALAPKKAPNPALAGPVMVTDRFACNRDFLGSTNLPTLPRARPEYEDPCTSCRGRGVIEETKTLSVKIPPGVDTGDRIRLAGEGEAAPNGGRTGDLYVQVAVKQHPIFERDGKHLYCEVPINFADAALGGDLSTHAIRPSQTSIPEAPRPARCSAYVAKASSPFAVAAWAICFAKLSSKPRSAYLKSKKTCWISSGNRPPAKAPAQIQQLVDSVKGFFDDL